MDVDEILSEDFLETSIDHANLFDYFADQTLQEFMFTKPTIVNMNSQDYPFGYVSAYPDRTEICLSGYDVDANIIPLIGIAKLAEIDYLLSTFLFSKSLVGKEIDAALNFYRLCLPIQDALVAKVLRNSNYEMYCRYMNLLEYAWQVVVKSKGFLDSIPEPIRVRIVLGYLATLVENSATNIAVDDKFILDCPEEYRTGWSNYIRYVLNVVRRDTSMITTSVYTDLVKAVNAPYLVSVQSNSYGRHYSVKLIE